MVATPCTAFDSMWYPDASFLMNKINYGDNEQIHVEDGIGLPIHRIGSASFLSQFNSRILYLNQLLRVPL